MSSTLNERLSLARRESAGQRSILASIDRNAITNPTLLVAVTSKSTEDYDRGEPLNHCKQYPSHDE